MQTDVRRETHELISAALASQEERRPEQLAHHARLAGRMGEARGWYVEAAENALSMNACRTAADHFGQADEAAQDVGVPLADRARDLLAYEAVLDVLGRRTEQNMLLKRLREVDLPLPVEIELVEREVWLLLNTDEQEKAVRLALDCAAQASDQGSRRVGLLTAAAVAQYQSANFNAVLDLARTALTESESASEVVAAETILGKALVDLAEHSEGERHLANAVSQAEQIGDDQAKVEAIGYQAVARVRAGRFADAEELFSRSLQLSRSIGYRWGEAANLGNLGALNADQGRGGQALANFDAASEVFGLLGERRGEAFVRANAAELRHRLLGDDESAMELASSAAVYFRSVGDSSMETFSMSLVSSIDRLQGRRRLARKQLNLLERARVTQELSSEAQVRRVLAQIEVESEEWAAAIVHLDRLLLIGEDGAIDAMLPMALAFRAYAAVQTGGLVAARECTLMVPFLLPVQACSTPTLLRGIAVECCRHWATPTLHPYLRRRTSCCREV